jgi:hypothetical protein
MHLGIFFYSGIFFWMWILVLVGLLFVFSKKVIDTPTLFNRTYFILAIPIILAGKFWVDPSPKVWFDSPLTYTYIFEATMANGEKHTLTPDFFAPYDVQFTFSNFRFLNERPLLPIHWGAHGSRIIHNYFKPYRSKSEIFDYETTQGIVYKDPGKCTFFKNFLTQFILNWNQTSTSRNLVSYLRAPRILWNFPRKNYNLNGKKIKSLKISEKTSYYSKQNGYKEIRIREILKITIPKKTVSQ